MIILRAIELCYEYYPTVNDERGQYLKFRVQGLGFEVRGYTIVASGLKA